MTMTPDKPKRKANAWLTPSGALPSAPTKGRRINGSVIPVTPISAAPTKKRKRANVAPETIHPLPPSAPIETTAKEKTSATCGLPSSPSKAKAMTTVTPCCRLPSPLQSDAAQRSAKPIAPAPASDPADVNLQYADTHEGRVRAAADNSEEAIMRVAPEHDMPLPVQLDVDGASHKAGDTLFSLARAAAIQQLRELQVRWSVTTRAKTRITNQTLAFVRRLIGFETRMDEAAREKVTKLAASIVSAVVKGKPLDDEHKAVADAAAPLIFASQQADAPYAAYRDGLEVEMEKLARALPVYPWVKSVKGLGDKTFAQIVGEVGDFSNYSNPGKVWRRMGLAPVNGQAASTWRMKGGLTAEDWTDLGYSPSRRSLMYVVGTCLMKAGGEYKKVYDDRKVYELARQADMKPIIAHRRAQRYMEKRLLRDLWREWRRADGHEEIATPSADAPAPTTDAEVSNV